MDKFFKNITKIPSNTVKFLRSVVAEMRKTEFPSRTQNNHTTAVVLGSAVMISLALLAIDSALIALRLLLTNISK